MKTLPTAAYNWPADAANSQERVKSLLDSGKSQPGKTGSGWPNSSLQLSREQGQATLRLKSLTHIPWSQEQGAFVSIV